MPGWATKKKTFLRLPLIDVVINKNNISLVSIVRFNIELAKTSLFFFFSSTESEWFVTDKEAIWLEAREEKVIDKSR